MVDQFEFLRPWWLIGIPVVIAIAVALHRLHHSDDWARFIPADKLRFLQFDKSAGKHNWRLLAGLFWVTTCVALAGPSFNNIPVPVAKNRDALVVIFDLSPSMLARDLQPDRLTRARLKLIDLLRLRNDGETALIVYAGDAHRIAPLTEDTLNVENLVSTLHPDIMPSPGSNIENAMELARELLTGAGLEKGDVLLITDGVEEVSIDAVTTITDESMRLFVLGVGTVEGAPIPASNGGFIRDQSGQIIISRLDEPRLTRLAEKNGGRYVSMQADNSGIEWLTSMTRDAQSVGESPDDRRFDQREDVGYWLLLALIPLALLAFRRNVVWIVILALPITPDTSHAFSWSDLWARADQQGAEALASQQPEKAATLFKRHDWQGVANYRAGDYTTAASQFAEQPTVTGHYNHGNALALDGKLPEAIAAYERALALEPEHDDALHNKAIVESLLEQQQEQEQQQQQQQQSQDQQQNQENEGMRDNQTREPSSDEESGEQQQADKESSQQQDQQNQQQDADQQSSDQQSAQDQQRSEQSQQTASSEDSASQGTAKETENVIDEQTPAANGEETKNEISEQQQEGDGSEADEEQVPLSPRSEQWLRTIPEDRGGLMRRKFRYEAFKKQREGDNRRQPMRY